MTRKGRQPLPPSLLSSFPPWALTCNWPSPGLLQDLPVLCTHPVASGGQEARGKGAAPSPQLTLPSLSCWEASTGQGESVGRQLPSLYPSGPPPAWLSSSLRQPVLSCRNRLPVLCAHTGPMATPIGPVPHHALHHRLSLPPASVSL